ncbi:type VI secretion lipoprotein TssJ [Providencia rettgeri]|uniref:type VI secretion lipoprotein TssJ n=2 Tax=Providencia rettgeri TaxID=587 RepID=UPI003018E82E
MQIRPFMMFTLAILCGCTDKNILYINKQQAIENVATPFSQGAIKLILHTTPDLNSFKGIANSCVLLIIQAQKLDSLNMALSDPFELKALFSAAGSQNNILKIDQYAAMPGQDITLHIDRSESARYFAVVGGYYPFPQKQHMIIVEIPVITEGSGWWNDYWIAKLATVTLNLSLGKNSINQIKSEVIQPAIFANSTISTGMEY